MALSVLTKLQDPAWWTEQCLAGDCYFLCRNVLRTLEGGDLNGFQDLYAPTHKRLTQFLERYAKPGQKLLILMARGWLKSSIVQGWIIQRMLRNFRAGIREPFLISNATWPNAREMLERIKYNLAHNEVLRGLFSEHIPQDPPIQAERWTMDEIQILGNRIETGSAEGNLVSRHFVVGINDDLVNKENSATADQIFKVIDWWKLYQSLLEPWGMELLVGTRWDEDDLYGYLLKTFLPFDRDNYRKPVIEIHRGNYHLLIVQCWEDPVARTGSTFPVKFPEWRLKQIEAEQQERFGGQYLLDPLSMTNKPFKPLWLNRTWDVNLMPAVRSTMMTLDIAGTEKETSDYTGMVVADAGVDKKIYVQYAKRRHVTDMEILEWLVEQACLYFPGIIGIEETKYQTMMDLLELALPRIIRNLRLKPEQAEYALTIPSMCVELKHRSRPKQLRIRNLTGFFEEGRMMLAPAGMEDLRDELLRFPTSHVDDTADALAYVLDLVVFPTQDDPEKVYPGQLSDEERQKFLEEQERMAWESAGAARRAFSRFDLY